MPGTHRKQHTPPDWRQHPTLRLQVVLPDVHRAEMDAVVFLPSEHAADDADTAEQRGAVAALQQVQSYNATTCSNTRLEVAARTMRIRLEHTSLAKVLASCKASGYSSVMYISPR